MTQSERMDHSPDRKCYPVSGGGTSENLDSIDVLRSVSLKGWEQEMKCFVLSLQFTYYSTPTLACFRPIISLLKNNIFISPIFQRRDIIGTLLLQPHSPRTPAVRPGVRGLLITFKQQSQEVRKFCGESEKAAKGRQRRRYRQST